FRDQLRALFSLAVVMQRLTHNVCFPDGAGVLRCAGGQLRLVLLIAQGVFKQEAASTLTQVFAYS
ncbi:hypothetical protein XENOCAPTIV_010565, partial [Xenoophorus captivus]